MTRALRVTVVTALVAGVAVATGAAGDPGTGRTAVGDPRAGRTYAGRIVNSAPIELTVSGSGRALRALAQFSPCRQLGIRYPELLFPPAQISRGRFHAARIFRLKTSTVNFAIDGRFLSFGHAAGTVSTRTTDYRLQQGHVCTTSKRWSAVLQRRSFRACAPHAFGIYGVAQDIVAEHTPCPVVERALRKGSFSPPPPPVASSASFSSPGWTCHRDRARARAWNCVSTTRSFGFALFS